MKITSTRIINIINLCKKEDLGKVKAAMTIAENLSDSRGKVHINTDDFASLMLHFLQDFYDK